LDPKAGAFHAFDCAMLRAKTLLVLDPQKKVKSKKEKL
jgi:hypothetical protein